MTDGGERGRKKGGVQISSEWVKRDTAPFPFGVFVHVFVSVDKRYLWLVNGCLDDLRLSTENDLRNQGKYGCHFKTWEFLEWRITWKLGEKAFCNSWSRDQLLQKTSRKELWDTSAKTFLSHAKSHPITLLRQFLFSSAYKKLEETAISTTLQGVFLKLRFRWPNENRRWIHGQKITIFK